MSPARKKRNRRKILRKSKKILSMEEKSPTMPSVVFLKYLKITGVGSDRQGKFEYAECVCDMKIQIPQFLGLPPIFGLAPMQGRTK